MSGSEVPHPLPVDRDGARVLIVDDDTHAARAAIYALAASGWPAELAPPGFPAGGWAPAPDDTVIVVADLPPGSRALDRLTTTLAAWRRPTALVACGADLGARETLDWIHRGADDVLLKPYTAEELVSAVGRAAMRATTRRSPVTAATGVPRDAIASLVGDDPMLARALELARSAAGVPSTVLVHGESGTGKSMLARAIHRASPRASMPFVEIACGSIPETLLESELFGHVKGAFTGALADKKGRFLAADGGTLFLDEINSASPTMQLKLLRVLQEKAFEAVGSDETIRVDVRVIAATNQPLEALVADGRFRQDLYYRINVLPIELPPLRERPQDVERLASHFLARKAADLDRTLVGFAPEAIEAMRAYAWPGNVRDSRTRSSARRSSRARRASHATTCPSGSRARRLRTHSPHGGFGSRTRTRAWGARRHRPLRTRIPRRACPTRRPISAPSPRSARRCARRSGRCSCRPSRRAAGTGRSPRVGSGSTGARFIGSSAISDSTRIATRAERIPSVALAPRAPAWSDRRANDSAIGGGHGAKSRHFHECPQGANGSRGHSLD